jgi:SAM-dependent methyltransferase
MYDEIYYRSGNYTDYLQRYGRYLKLVDELHSLLANTCIADKNQPVLDFGCGVGFVCHALEELGYKQVEGYDISRWAAHYAKKHFHINIATRFGEIVDRDFHVVLMLDVLEHIKEGDIYTILDRIHAHYIVVRIPVADTHGGTFAYGLSRRDPTHITARTKTQWISLFKRCDYRMLFKLNLHTIWDSRGVFCAVFESA